MAELLRTSRLALLFGQAGSDKTALLKNDLMPLLRRRAGDRLGPSLVRESGVVVPFPDRRGRATERAGKRRRELVIYFEEWNDRPLDALHARIQLAAAMPPDERAAPRVRLADTLALLSGRLDASFIVLLDRCEELVRAPLSAELAAFADELVEAINQPRLAANFLIALDEGARPHLASLRSRIAGFDDFSLKLGRALPAQASAAALKSTSSEPVTMRPPAQREETLIEPEQLTAAVAAAPPPLAAQPSPAPTTKPKPPRTPPPRITIKTEDVYKLIESTLSQTVTDGSEDPFSSRRMAPHSPRPGEGFASAQPVLNEPFGEPDAATPNHAAGHAASGASQSKLAAALDWTKRLLRLKPRAA